MSKRDEQAFPFTYAAWLGSLKSVFFFVGIALALLIWIANPFIDAVILGEGTLFQQLTQSTTREIYFRSIVSSLIIIFSYMGSFLLNRSRQAEDKLRESEGQFRDLVENFPQGIFVHRDFKPLFANQQCADMFGYSDPEEILALESILESFWASDEQERMHGYKTSRMEGGEAPTVYEYEGLRKDGSPFWFESFEMTVDWRGGEAIQVTVIDITRRKQEEEKLKYLAVHDPLTGLPNRNELERRINEETSRATRYNHLLSVFMLDIDHFKQINDTHGHRVGDSVLCSISRVLERSIRKIDFVARYGGEEFVIVLPETPLVKAEELAQRLLNQIAEFTFPIDDDKEFNLTISIGIATFPEHAQSWVYLLETADLAMYAAKKAGRNQVKTPEMMDQENSNFLTKHEKS